MRRPRFFSTLAAVALLGALGACRPQTAGPAPLDFDADPRILRGLWTGESIDGHTLLINSNPTNPTEFGYAVEGTFRLDNRESIAFSGGVRADVTHDPQSVFPQTSPGYAPFDARSYDDLWQLFGDAPAGSPPQFEVTLGGVTEGYTFTMTGAVPTALAGTRWVLETLQGEPVLRDTEITLDVDDQWFGGTSGCNGYGGTYLATATTFKIADGILSTLVLCDTPMGVMEQEEAYTRALAKVTTYQITGDRLEMRDDTNTVILTFSD